MIVADDALRCLLCGSNDLHPWKPGRPLILQCRSCGGGWVSEPPTAVNIEAQYQQDYYQEASGARFLKLVELAVLALKRLRYRSISSLTSGPGQLLDVGCGRGDLILEFQRHGWQAVGTQLSRTATAAAKANRCLDILLGDLPDLELPPDAFDVITFFHVLEHLPDPASHLQTAFTCLKDTGIVVIEVPNFRTIGFYILGRRHLCYDQPHHLIFFSPRGLKALLDSCGFQIQASCFFSLEYGPFTILQNWLNLLPGEPNRLYRSLMGNRAGKSLRHHPLTWIHAALGLLLALPAALLASVSLLLPVGNTLRVYCRKKPL